MKLPPIGENQICLGVALEVPEPLASRIQQARGYLLDQDAHLPPHITLVPPLALDQDQLPAVQAHLAAAVRPHRPFQIRLHSTDTFRPVSPTVFLALQQGAQACAALEADLRTGPLACQTDFDFHPHVTVAHQVDQATLNRAQTALASFDESFVASEVDLWQLQDAGAVTHLARYCMAGQS